MWAHLVTNVDLKNHWPPLNQEEEERKRRRRGERTDFKSKAHVSRLPNLLRLTADFRNTACFNQVNSQTPPHSSDSLKKIRTDIINFVKHTWPILIMLILSLPHIKRRVPSCRTDWKHPIKSLKVSSNHRWSLEKHEEIHVNAQCEPRDPESCWDRITQNGC